MLYSITGRASLISAVFLISVTSLRLHSKRTDETLDETLHRLIEQAEASGINKTIIKTKSTNDSKIVYLSAPSNDKQNILDDMHNDGVQAPTDQHNQKHGMKTEEKEKTNEDNNKSDRRRKLQLNELSRSGHRDKKYTETLDDYYSIEVEPILEDTSPRNLKMRNRSLADLSIEHENTYRNGFMSDEDHSGQKSSPLLHENPENLMEILKELESKTLISEMKAVHTENLTPAPLLDNKKTENIVDENIKNTHNLGLEDLKRIKELLEISMKQNVQSKNIIHPESERTETVRVTDEDLMKAYYSWFAKRRQEEFIHSPEGGPLKKLTDIPSTVTIPEFAPSAISIASIAARLAAMNGLTRTVIHSPGISLLNKRPCATCRGLTPLLRTAQNWKFNQYMTNQVIKKVYQPHTRRTFCTTCRI
ncbi:hypothetical protein O0L34_g17231 [Tuta absoluta]|nr:hypothetical protein O0L34_g17231 [Tuta absoluta]